MENIKCHEDFFPSNEHAFCVFTLNNQSMFDLHGHEFDELVIVRSGCGFHVVNDQAEMIREGDFFFVTANDVHYYEATSSLSLINVLMHRDRHFKYLKDIECLLERIAFNTRPFSYEYQPLVMRSLNRVINLAGDISQHRDDAFDFIYFSSTESSLLQILTILCQSIGSSKNAGGEEKNRAWLLDYIRLHYAQDINWRGVCEEHRIAIRTFYRYFKMMTGKTPEKFHQLYRLLKAQEFLRTTDISVGRIATLCGFMTSSRLTEAYHRYFQHTPSQERQLSSSINKNT